MFKLDFIDDQTNSNIMFKAHKNSNKLILNNNIFHFTHSIHLHVQIHTTQCMLLFSPFLKKKWRRCCYLNWEYDYHKLNFFYSVGVIEFEVKKAILKIRSCTFKIS